MNIDIRKSITSNFKDSTIEEFESSIEEAIKDQDELTLPGMGVFFELLWKNSSVKEKNNILKKIKENLV